MAQSSNNHLKRWQQDPIAFVSEALVDPETSRPFQLYPAEKQFLRHALTLTPEGRLPHPELLFGAPKKSGKTALAGMAAIYVAVAIGGPFAEVYCLSNDYDQSVGRVFTAAKRIIEGSPLLRDSARITADKIEFSSGSFIEAVASDYAGFAGANPSLAIFDELWAYVSERAQRLFDEAVPSPTRKVSGRLTVSYAGFESESLLLERLYRAGIAGEMIAPDLYQQDGLLCYWTHRPPAPWQSPVWLSQMRQQLRPNQYLRMIENRFVTSESSFVDMDDYDACVDPAARPTLSDSHLRIFVGLDGSYARDSMAVAAVTFDNVEQRVKLINHKIFTPTSNEPVDFAAVEAELMRLRRAFALQAVFFDPYQLVALAQRLTLQGFPMEAFVQSGPNLDAAATNLAELIRHHSYSTYADDEIRLALTRTVAIETPRGIRISKAKTSHRIDIVAAISFACFAAVRGGQFAGMSDGDRAFMRRAAEYLYSSGSRYASRSSRFGDISDGNNPHAIGEAVADAEDRQEALARRTRSAFNRRVAW